MPDVEGELRARAAADGVEFFFALFVDMHGRPCAKMVPVEALGVMLGGGSGFAGFAAGPMGQSPADPDMIAVPDVASYTLAPWQPGLAVLHCDISVEGEPWPYTPRLILKRMVEKARARGLAYQVGVEAEYFLVRRDGDNGIEVADPLDRMAGPCRLVFFRYMVHTIAHRAGLAATFMPKPFANLTGSGLHMHSSLWDAATGAELFADPADPRGLGISQLGYQYIAGLIDHGPALAGVTCPTVNSYKRMGVGAPLSGATWAPAYATYGGNNRTQMLRVPEAGRVENRAVDGSANPYLAMAAQLAAGLDGIDRGLDPGEPNKDNLYLLSADEVGGRGIRTMPPTLLHAMDELVADDVMRDALGKTADGDYVDYYAKVKREEFHAWHSVVSDWEVERYLTLF